MGQGIIKFVFDILSVFKKGMNFSSRFWSVFRGSFSIFSLKISSIYQFISHIAWCRLINLFYITKSVRLVRVKYAVRRGWSCTGRRWWRNRLRFYKVPITRVQSIPNQPLPNLIFNIFEDYANKNIHLKRKILIARLSQGTFMD